MAEKPARKTRSEMLDELIADIKARFNEYDDAIEQYAERKGGCRRDPQWWALVVSLFLFVVGARIRAMLY